ncbi:endoplasmic reticulum junction formation protein lunapark-like isoform X2 [Chiloscyllium punctatum]|uniref:endoplasmic reticulum junction formation protein lunapark-like isoform X2 n=1 Tax=Chiloscyllium punctatum TaxID=137246 RepID=UPI003B63518C
MGAMLSCWRAKPSTIEVLEKIDKEINALEEFREKNQRLQKIWIGRLVLYSSTLYIITFIIVYMWCFPEEWDARLTLALPGFLFPLLVWLIRKILIWLFCKRTERNSEALEGLKVQKKKILEEVMEKETYKNAKLILERFDPESKKATELDQLTSGMPATPRPGQELRQRSSTQKAQVPSTPQNLTQGSPRPLPAPTPIQHSTTAPGGPPEKTLQSVLHTPALGRRTVPPAASMPGMGLHPPGPPLARPILPRDRGAVDRIIEYLVGDGPQNRYALICQQCFSHNGMALKEEFEYVGKKYYIELKVHSDVRIASFLIRHGEHDLRLQDFQTSTLKKEHVVILKALLALSLQFMIANLLTTKMQMPKHKMLYLSMIPIKSRVVKKDLLQWRLTDVMTSK